MQAPINRNLNATKCRYTHLICALILCLTLSNIFIIRSYHLYPSRHLTSAIHHDSIVFPEEYDTISKLVNNNSVDYYILLSLENKRNVPNFAIFTISLEMRRNILYHCNYLDSGLGNRLLSYWFIRSLAFYFNFEYQFLRKSDIDSLETTEYIKSILHKYLRCADKNQHSGTLTDNLTFYSNYTFNKYLISHDIDILNGFQIQLYSLHSMFAAYTSKFDNTFENDLFATLHKFRTIDHNANLMFPWGTREFKMFYLNDLFIQNVILPETHKVFEDMFAASKSKKFNKFDISIHIRCGDIIRGRAFSVEYGFQTLSFYKEGFKQIFHRLNSNKSNYNGHIYILMQLLDSNDLYQSINTHKDDTIEDFRQCRKVYDRLIDAFQENIFNEYGYKQQHVKLISNGTIYEDFYQLMMSSNVICGVSTFCFSAILSNNAANTIIIPKVESKNEELIKLPNRIVSVADDQMLRSPYITRKHMNSTQIAEYIINH